MNQDSPQVSIIVGSTSDAGAVETCQSALDAFGIAHEARVLSAHRTPKELVDYVEGLQARGVKVVVAGAGMAAHLAGVVAAHTTLPVIGVPLAAGSLQGFDALLSVSQMPGGVPVACMGIGNAGAKNAAYLAARILSLAQPEVAKRMKERLRADREKVLESTLQTTGVTSS